MKRFGALLAVGWVAATLPSCASEDATSCTPSSCTGYPPNEDAPSTRDTSMVLPEASPLGDSGPSRNSLCGSIGCFPGNMSACGATPTGDAAGYPYPFADANDATAIDSAAIDASDAAAIDAADTSPSETSTDAGAPESSVDSSKASDANTIDAADGPNDVGTTDEPRIAQSCYIRPTSAGVMTECGPVGHVPDGGACQDSSDCIALDACVDVDASGTGVCRAVSCALPITCQPGSFYQEAALRVSGATRADLKVPVCLPNSHCMLLATSDPCTKGQVCAVVGSKGETTCIVPGAGKQGDACDETQAKRCGPGLLCSKFNNQCVRLCHVAADVTECTGGTCQGGNNSIPEGFGICVGETPDASR